MVVRDKYYHRQKSDESYQRRKKEVSAAGKRARERNVRIIKESKDKCLMCPETETVALDFHHLYGKERTVGCMRSYSEERLRAEIAKCVVLCKNCHAKVHAGIIVLPDVVESLF